MWRPRRFNTNASRREGVFDPMGRLPGSFACARQQVQFVQSQARWAVWLKFLKLSLSLLICNENDILTNFPRFSVASELYSQSVWNRANVYCPTRFDEAKATAADVNVARIASSPIWSLVYTDLQKQPVGWKGYTLAWKFGFTSDFTIEIMYI